MKTAHLLAAILAAGSSIPFFAQQPGPAAQQQAPPTPPSASPEQTMPQASAAPSAPAASAADMKPVNGQLVSDLDSRTAKTGDSIIIETKQTVKTADGTEIPRGSKLVGHVLGVKPSGQGGENSQLALAFDRAELKGGQTVPVKTELRSLSPPGNETESATPPNAEGSGSATGSASPGSNVGGPRPRSATGAGTSQTPDHAGSAQESTAGAGSAAANGQPPAGVVVARTGNIDIRTTAIPGVLLANNQPGMQDPRMEQSSGILLGARRDVHLDGGTQVVIAVADAGTKGGGN